VSKFAPKNLYKAQMKKIFSFICLSLSTMFLLTSCLNSNDDSYYGDTAITAFTLGTLNRYVHVKTSAGKDSTYKTTLTGSSYNFYIDQTNRTIYNPDSLPIWTDNSKVVCTITSKNSGVVYYKSLKSDSVFYHSSSDSVDFSKPRTFYVFATDGSAYRQYTINVNVHQELSDTFIWHRISTNSTIAAFTGMKALELNGTILLFGTNGSETAIYSTPEAGGEEWTKMTTNVTLDADAYKNIVIHNGLVFVKSNRSILKSSDGISWTTITGTTDIENLVASSTTRLFATKDHNLISSLDEGLNWTKENLDEDSTLLPSRDFTYYTMPLASNDSIDRVMIVGNRSFESYPDDTTSVVWNKIEEYSNGNNTGTWTYYNVANDNYSGYAPRLTNFTMVPYDDGVLAFGGDGLGKSKATAFDHFYQSRDNGITWKNNSTYYFPDGFSSSKTSFTAVKDTKNNLWLICGESGQIWRGRLNRLGWDTIKTTFTE
jgi:hypothetical protein